MPTHFENSLFLRDLKRLPPEQLALFEARLEEFKTDLLAMEAGHLTWFRAGLRVKKVKGAQGVYELTWDRDGRATFTWGAEQIPGKLHVIWLRIGGHDILP